MPDPRGGLRGTCPPEETMSALRKKQTKKNNLFFHVNNLFFHVDLLLKGKVGGGAQMTDTGLQMIGFKIHCSLVTADTTLLYLSKQNWETGGGGGGTYPKSKAVGLDGS